MGDRLKKATRQKKRTSRGTNTFAVCGASLLLLSPAFKSDSGEKTGQPSAHVSVESQKSFALEKEKQELLEHLDSLLKFSENDYKNQEKIMEMEERTGTLLRRMDPETLLSLYKALEKDTKALDKKLREKGSSLLRVLNAGTAYARTLEGGTAIETRFGSLFLLLPCIPDLLDSKPGKADLLDPVMMERVTLGFFMNTIKEDNEDNEKAGDAVLAWARGGQPFREENLLLLFKNLKTWLN